MANPVSKTAAIKGGILLIMGLPGSGKTTVSEQLRTKLSSDSLAVYVISFDNLVSVDKQKELSRTFHLWRQERLTFYGAIAAFVSKLCGGEESQLTNQEQVFLARIFQSNNQLVQGKTFLVIIDDNFYLRSMRYRFAQIAKSLSLGFAQLMLDVPLTTCIARNNARCSNHVPEHIILNMSAEFESPKASSNKWEKYSLIVDNEIDDTQIATLIEGSINEPLSKGDKDVSEDESRQQSLLHCLDCLLRKATHEEVDAVVGSEKGEVAQRCSIAKKQILQKVKHSEIDLPEWFIVNGDIRTLLEENEALIYVADLLRLEASLLQA